MGVLEQMVEEGLARMKAVEQAEVVLVSTAGEVSRTITLRGAAAVDYAGALIARDFQEGTER